MSDYNLFAVNWQDGMLITRQHLKDQEAYFEELARWYAGDVGDRYGLVRKSLSGKPSLSLNVVLHGSQISVEVLRCQAIAPDGSVVEINELGRNLLRAETPATTGNIPAYIGSDPSSRKQVGEPDPSEDLPRMPYLVREYSLHLGARPNIPEGRCLQIAELTISGNEVSHSGGYYPPCLTISADERLTQKALEFRNRLESLLSLASSAFKALSAVGALAGEKTELQNAFRDTIFQIVYHLGATLDEYVVGRNAIHPSQLVVLFKKLFRVFSTLFNLHPGVKDYLNEKYFAKELNTDIGRFIASVDALLMTEYDHQDIGGHLSVIDSTLTTLRGVMGFLAQMKKEQLASDAAATDTLTYNGRTYRMVAYSSSRLEQVGELSYLVIEVAEPRAISDTVVLLAKDLYSVGEWNNMQVRLGLNQSRGMGETDPVEVDTTTYGNKVAFRPPDILKSPSVRQVTLIVRGARDPGKLAKLGKMDLVLYAM